MQEVIPRKAEEELGGDIILVDRCTLNTKTNGHNHHEGKMGAPGSGGFPRGLPTDLWVECVFPMS